MRKNPYSNIVKQIKKASPLYIQFCDSETVYICGNGHYVFKTTLSAYMHYIIPNFPGMPIPSNSPIEFENCYEKCDGVLKPCTMDFRKFFSDYDYKFFAKPSPVILETNGFMQRVLLYKKAYRTVGAVAIDNEYYKMMLELNPATINIINEKSPVMVQNSNDALIVLPIRSELAQEMVSTFTFGLEKEA